MNFRAWLTARITSPPRYRVFCGLGGSGSTALLRALRRSGRFVRCGERVDVPFLPPDTVPPYFEPGRQVLDDRGFDAAPLPGAMREFRARSGYRLHRDWSIGENLLAYLEHAARRHHAVMLGTAFHVGFLSEAGIRDVVFLVRHPLHSYVSWTKEERHLKNIDRLGGPEREESVRFWANLWNKLVAEYLALRAQGFEPVLVRYEFAREDAAVAGPELAAYFRGWDGSKRNAGVLSPELEELLRKGVDESYPRLYSTWDL